MNLNRLIVGECCHEMQQLKKQGFQADLICMDPPYNIGIPYDGYDDNRHLDLYKDSIGDMIEDAIDLLASNGSLFFIINDEQAAWIKCLLDDYLTMRNWLIWNYGFGEAQQKKFSRCKSHILYYVGDNKNFTFNADAIRIPSDRQTKYADGRARETGKLPDDVWRISRVCGTFKERVEGFPCQLPEKLLERIILATTNPNDVILDPMSGSGTSLAVAKRLGRRWLGIEQSPKYAAMAAKRIAEVDVGFDLGV